MSRMWVAQRNHCIAIGRKIKCVHTDCKEICVGRCVVNATKKENRRIAVLHRLNRTKSRYFNWQSAMKHSTKSDCIKNEISKIKCLCHMKIAQQHIIASDCVSSATLVFRFTDFKEQTTPRCSRRCLRYLCMSRSQILMLKNLDQHSDNRANRY